MLVLIITPEYRGFGGGIMTYYRHLAPALVRAGCAVRIVEGSGLAAFERRDPEVLDGVDVERLEAERLNGWLNRFEHLRATPTLRRMLAAAWAAWDQAGEGRAPDVVEATDFGLLGVPPLLTAQHPVVLQHHGAFGQIHLHEPDGGLEVDSALALALETAATTIAVAPQTNANANAQFWMHQTGLEVPCLRPAWRGANDIESKPVEDRIAVFGRIQGWKGPKVLCEALRILPSTPPMVWHGRDVAVGGASTDKALRVAYPEIWGLRVEPRPPVAPETVASLQASSKLNLVPSTWDVFNFTVIEAMHSGRPVVCSNGAGASELIEDGVTGFVYEGASPDALAKTLSRSLALTEPELTEIGRRAKQAIAKLLNPDAIARERIAAYRAAMVAHTRHRKILPDWVSQIAMPREKAAPGLSFLDRQPLSDLTGYVAARMLRKAGLTS